MGNQPCFPDIKQDHFFYVYNTFEMGEESQIQKLNRNSGKQKERKHKKPLKRKKKFFSFDKKYF